MLSRFFDVNVVPGSRRREGWRWFGERTIADKCGTTKRRNLKAVFMRLIFATLFNTETGTPQHAPKPSYACQNGCLKVQCARKPKAQLTVKMSWTRRNFSCIPDLLVVQWVKCKRNSRQNNKSKTTNSYKTFQFRAVPGIYRSQVRSHRHVKD